MSMAVPYLRKVHRPRACAGHTEAQRSEALQDTKTSGVSRLRWDKPACPVDDSEQARSGRRPEATTLYPLCYTYNAYQYTYTITIIRFIDMIMICLWLVGSPVLSGKVALPPRSCFGSLSRPCRRRCLEDRKQWQREGHLLHTCGRVARRLSRTYARNHERMHARMYFVCTQSHRPKARQQQTAHSVSKKHTHNSIVYTTTNSVQEHRGVSSCAASHRALPHDAAATLPVGVPQSRSPGTLRRG